MSRICLVFYTGIAAFPLSPIHSEEATMETSAANPVSSAGSVLATGESDDMTAEKGSINA